MKEGLSLSDASSRLKKIKNESKDYIVPTRALTMQKGLISFENNTFRPTEYAHGQIASYAGIPKQYYDRLRSENQSILDQCVNHGFTTQCVYNEYDKNGERKPLAEARLIRSTGSYLRALLSPSYRPLDNYDLLNAILPFFEVSQYQLVPHNAQITDTKFYIKALTQKKSEVNVGDVVQYGIIISNSEVGAGALRIEPLILRLICQNGMIASSKFRAAHLEKSKASDFVELLMSDKTRQANDAAFWLKVADTMKYFLTSDFFEKEVEKMRHASKNQIKNFNIPEVVSKAAEIVGIKSEDVKNIVTAYLANGANGAGLTQYGLSNGFTFAAHKAEIDYDQSIELERAGGAILDLKPEQWKKIAEVAA